MVQTYKNFFIIDRNDTVQEAVEMAKNLGTYFDDDRRVWHIKNTYDKIILIYENNFYTDNAIRTYTTAQSVNFQIGTCIGYIQIYCNKNFVKVNKYQFKNSSNAYNYWKTFKQYLTQSIRNTSMLPSRVTPILYWERKLMNNDIQRLVERVGLLSNRNNMTYTFQDSDIVENNLISDELTFGYVY